MMIAGVLPRAKLQGSSSTFCGHALKNARPSSCFIHRDQPLCVLLIGTSYTAPKIQINTFANNRKTLEHSIFSNTKVLIGIRGLGLRASSNAISFAKGKRGLTQVIPSVIGVDHELVDEGFKGSKQPCSVVVENVETFTWRRESPKSEKQQERMSRPSAARICEERSPNLKISRFLGEIGQKGTQRKGGEGP